MNKVFSILFIFLFVSTNYASNIPSKDRTALCNYESFLNKATTNEERVVREDLYLKLIGIIESLGGYRQKFLRQGNLIDLFPTAYYHTTLSETLKIVDNKYHLPIEKINQLIAFYDAYQRNRLYWDSGKKQLVELHWEKHFYEASSGLSDVNFACSGIASVLESAIEAHVIYDLPRALRYAFDNRRNKGIRPKDLLPEFEATNKIFSSTNQKTKSDIASILNCAVWWQDVGEAIFGRFYKTDGDVIKLRKDAWNLAFTPLPINGLDNSELLSQPFTNHLELLNKGKSICRTSPTLFLFDLSGSMSQNGAGSSKSKLQQAKEASKTTLASLNTNQSGSKPEIGILGFSGGCPGPNMDPTTGNPNWDTDFTIVQNRIDGLSAGGGTPLYEAIEAAQCKLANRLVDNNQNSGKLIVLSDGAATCKKIRPQGVYNSSTVYQWKIDVSGNNCGGNTSIQIKYYTIGFNVNPGSPAERDLQFLAQSTGGKYLNVQSQTQLERAFRKFNRTYIPKPNPALNNLSTSSNSQFDKGVSQINSESFVSALESCKAFSNLHTDDCHGAYNFALMLEANDFYKKAITNYQKYLSLCPNPVDEEFVEKQILFLEEAYKQFLIFQKKVILSDLEYLKLHFEKIQNGESVALAEEFKGFLKEKGEYYINLAELMGRSDRLFKKNTKEVANGLNTCAKTINRNPETWDRDATPALSMTYLNLERLLESL